MNKQFTFSSLRKYFELITTIAVKNLSLRYKNSVFGFMWSLLTPLMYLFIFIFVFSHVFNDIENYPLYVLTGLVFWTFFSNSTLQIMRSILDSASVLKSISIPPIVFPVSALLSSVINLLLSLIPFFIIMLFFGFKPGWSVVMIIPFILIFSLFVFGFSLILCTLNIYFRDVEILWNTLTPALFYATPIAYSGALLPAKYIWIIKLNPLYHFIEFSREVLYYNRMPSLAVFITTIILALTFLMGGLLIFRGLKKGFYTNL